MYRLPSLVHKTLGDILTLALADPKCPIAGPAVADWARQHTGPIALYELLVKGDSLDECKLSTLRALEPSERVLDVLTRWDADERILIRAQRRASGVRTVATAKANESDEEENEESEAKEGKEDKEARKHFVLLMRRADDDTLRKRVEKAQRLPSGARELLDDVKRMRLRQRLEQRLTAKKLVAELSAFVDQDTGRYLNSVANDVDAHRPLSVALSAAANTALAQGARVRAPTALVTALEHERLLVAWLNKHLKAHKLFVSNLHRDLRSGVALLRVLESLSGARLREFYRHPRDAQQCLQNLDLSLRFLERLRVPIVQGARAQHFYRGDMTVVFGQVYLLMRRVVDRTALRKHLQRRSQKSHVSKDGQLDLAMTRSQRFSILPTELQSIARQATSSPTGHPGPVTSKTTIQRVDTVAPPSSAPPPPPDYVGGSVRVTLEPRFSVRANAAHRSAIVLQSPLWQAAINDELDDLNGWEDMGDEFPLLSTLSKPPGERIVSREEDDTRAVSPIVSPRTGISRDVSTRSEIDIDALLDDDPRELGKLASKSVPPNFYSSLALELELESLDSEAVLNGQDDDGELYDFLSDNNADIEEGMSFQEDEDEADLIIAQLLAECLPDSVKL